MKTHARPGPALSDIGATPRRDGRWWVFPSGYHAPVVAGGSGGQGQGGNAGGDAVVDPPGGTGGGNAPAGTGDPAAGGSGPAGQGAPGAGAGAGAGLTQADVDRAAREAKKAAETELAAALGCSIDEAKTIIADRKAAQDAEKSDAQRAREAADAEKSDAAAEKAAAAAERRALRVERALLVVKVKDDRSANAARLVLADLADEADEAAVTAAVEKFAKDTPEWFGDNAPPPPGSDPAGRGPAGGGGGQKTGIEAGRERARLAREAREKAGGDRAADPFGRIGRRIGA